MKFCTFVWLLLVLLCWKLSESVDISFTLSIPPKRRECLHETMNEGVEYEVEYQVFIFVCMKVTMRTAGRERFVRRPAMRKAE